MDPVDRSQSAEDSGETLSQSKMAGDFEVAMVSELAELQATVHVILDKLKDILNGLGYSKGQIDADCNAALEKYRQLFLARARERIDTPKQR